MDDVFEGESGVESDLSGAEKAIGVSFRDKKLLELALTHPSYRNEQHCEEGDNERLEFLGDAVISLVVSAMAYQRFWEATEGDLTRARARLISRQTLSGIARALDLGRFMRLGQGARRSDSVAERDSVLCAAFEAVVGAIFLDSGYEVAKNFVERCLGPEIEKIALSELKDPKTKLQEYFQAQRQKVPRYRTLAHSGPAHAPIFEVEVVLPTGETFLGMGGSRKEAEQEAARKALEALGGRGEGGDLEL